VFEFIKNKGGYDIFYRRFVTKPPFYLINSIGYIACMVKVAEGGKKPKPPFYLIKSIGYKVARGQGGKKT